MDTSPIDIRKRKQPETKYLSLRLTPLQKETLQAQAELLGYKSLTHMIRAVADEMQRVPPIPPPVPPPVPREISSIATQIQAVGHLVNQMARALNSKVYRQEPLFEGDLRRIDANIKTIHGFLDAILRICEKQYEAQ